MALPRMPSEPLRGTEEIYGSGQWAAVWSDAEGQSFRKSPDALPSDEISARAWTHGSALDRHEQRLARFQITRTRYTTQRPDRQRRELLARRRTGIPLDRIQPRSDARAQRLSASLDGSINLVPCRAYGKADGLPTRGARRVPSQRPIAGGMGSFGFYHGGAGISEASRTSTEPFSTAHCY
jgi:hypothetical protein